MQNKPELNNNLTTEQLKDVITIQIHPNIMSNLYYIKDLLGLELMSEALAHCVGYVLDNQINPKLKEHHEQQQDSPSIEETEEDLSIPEPEGDPLSKFKYKCDVCGGKFNRIPKRCVCGTNFKKRPDLCIDLINEDNRGQRPEKEKKGGSVWD